MVVTGLAYIQWLPWQHATCTPLNTLSHHRILDSRTLPLHQQSVSPSLDNALEMDTSYLSQQVNSSIGQLHGLFDEIGVPNHEREARESEVRRCAHRRERRPDRLTITAVRGSLGSAEQPGAARHGREEGPRRRGQEDHHNNPADGGVARRLKTPPRPGRRRIQNHIPSYAVFAMAAREANTDQPPPQGTLCRSKECVLPTRTSCS